MPCVPGLDRLRCLLPSFVGSRFAALLLHGGTLASSPLLVATPASSSFVLLPSPSVWPESNFARYHADSGKAPKSDPRRRPPSSAPADSAVVSSGDSSRRRLTASSSPGHKIHARTHAGRQRFEPRGSVCCIRLCARPNKRRRVLPASSGLSFLRRGRQALPAAFRRPPHAPLLLPPCLSPVAAPASTRRRLPLPTSVVFCPVRLLFPSSASRCAKSGKIA